MAESNTHGVTTPKNRDEISLEVANSSGICYFNPFIGGSAAQTCEKLNDGFGLLHYLLSRGVAEDIQPGLSMLAQTMWAAAQFEMEAGELSKGGAA